MSIIHGDVTRTWTDRLCSAAMIGNFGAWIGAVSDSVLLLSVDLILACLSPANEPPLAKSIHFAINPFFYS